jgi:hypothetical protein
MGPDDFIRDALKNRHNRLILDHLPALELPDAWLVAGCLFQTAWNVRSGQPPEAHIKDYDLFYFDPTDLSEAAETEVNARVQARFAGHSITVEAKTRPGSTPGTRTSSVSPTPPCAVPARESTVSWSAAPAWA